MTLKMLSAKYISLWKPFTDYSSLQRFSYFSHIITPDLHEINPKIQFFQSPSDSFMIMSLYTTRDYVPPDFCGILSLMIFYYEEITL